MGIPPILVLSTFQAWNFESSHRHPQNQKVKTLPGMIEKVLSWKIMIISTNKPTIHPSSSSFKKGKRGLWPLVERGQPVNHWSKSS